MIFFGNEDEQSDVPKYHASNTRQRYNFFNKLLKQVSEDVIFGNEDEQSDVPKYHEKETILLFYDEYLINI